MTMELHWDLTEDATRQHLRDDVFARLGEDRAARVREQVCDLDLGAAHFHTAGEIGKAVDATDLPLSVKNDVAAIYAILADAEAQVHGVPVTQTHFHEVGDAEAVRNVLAVCLALHELQPVRITATPVQTGSGTVVCAHGELDIPAPATAAILSRGIPVCAEKREGERCTPTSAAIIAHFVEEFDA